MQDLAEVLHKEVEKPIQILDTSIPLSKYTAIDLSVNNEALKTIDITKPKACEAYIRSILERENATVAFGGYLERRSLYSKSLRFSEGPTRDIHLGCDFWCGEGTKVIVPLDGTVHSFKNNDDAGNYGPTVILKHEIGGVTFHTLYGHLSLQSLKEVYQGKDYFKGETLGDLGSSKINGGYSPHLHFQLILSMEDYRGDYLGVCSAEDLDYYAHNCPDPNLLLGITY